MDKILTQNLEKIVVLSKEKLNDIFEILFGSKELCNSIYQRKYSITTIIV